LLDILKFAQQQGGKISTRDLCRSRFKKIQIEGKKFSAYFASKFLQAITRTEASDRDMAEEIRDLLSGEG
jgi:hypothetical protein